MIVEADERAKDCASSHTFLLIRSQLESALLRNPMCNRLSSTPDKSSHCQCLMISSR